MSQKTFVVEVLRWRKGLVLIVPDVGSTQSYGWADAELMVRDYIESMEVPGAEDALIRFEFEASVMRPAGWRTWAILTLPPLRILSRFGAGEISPSEAE